MKNLIALASLIFIFGCATVGKEVSADQAAQFEKGKTTKAEIIAKLGPPTGQSTIGDGRETISYAFMKYQTRPETFIPLVGIFVGGADVRNSSVTYVFNASGVLETFTQNSNNTASSTAINPSNYDQPNRALPSATPQK